MNQLPTNIPWDLADDRWAAIINPLLKSPANNSLILKNISLLAGNNVVNHRLGQNLQGWSIVRQRASGTVYDSQDSNQTPQLTLVLIASAPMVVDLMVF